MKKKNPKQNTKELLQIGWGGDERSLLGINKTQDGFSGPYFFFFHVGPNQQQRLSAVTEEVFLCVFLLSETL